MSIDLTSPGDHSEIIENIEKSSTRMVCQAVLDFAKIAKEQFSLAKDLAGTVGEDVTRDAMESMGLTKVPTARLIGKIDYKRAVYYFDPEYWVRQALFVDSKAERSDNTSATIQITQTSLSVRMRLRGVEIHEPGRLDKILNVSGENYLVTTIFVKYFYHVLPAGDNELRSIFVVCLPNGMLQETYNPDATETIWRVGRHAHTRGEEFRVRIHFPLLKAKRKWRVQTIHISPDIRFVWDD